MLSLAPGGQLVCGGTVVWLCPQQDSQPSAGSVMGTPWAPFGLSKTQPRPSLLDAGVGMGRQGCAWGAGQRSL